MVRENAAALQPGDRIAWKDDKVATVLELGPSFYVPFPGFYAREVTVEIDNAVKQIMLKPDVEIPLVEEAA